MLIFRCLPLPFMVSFPGFQSNSRLVISADKKYKESIIRQRRAEEGEGGERTIRNEKQCLWNTTGSKGKHSGVGACYCYSGMCKRKIIKVRPGTAQYGRQRELTFCVWVCVCPQGKDKKLLTAQKQSGRNDGFKLSLSDLLSLLIDRPFSDSCTLNLPNLFNHNPNSAHARSSDCMFLIRSLSRLRGGYVVRLDLLVLEREYPMDA